MRCSYSGINMYFHFVAILLCSFYLNLSYSAYVRVCQTSLFDGTIEATLPDLSVEQFIGLEVEELTVLERDWNAKNDTINSVLDFTHLRKIVLENLGLKSIPKFINLPQLNDISLFNNTIVSVTTNAFVATSAVTINLSTNKIRSIQDGSFGEKVEHVLLGCNKLNRFSNRWFKNPSVLKTLSLTKNEITNLEANVFKHFLNLQVLDLSYNQIRTIGDEALSGPRKFTTLNLSNNKLSEINATSFSSNLNVIEKFLLGSNKLSFLSEELLDKLELDALEIDANPWQCPCRKKIQKWIIENNVTSVVGVGGQTPVNPVCLYALTKPDECVDRVSTELAETYLKYLNVTNNKFTCEQGVN